MLYEVITRRSRPPDEHRADVDENDRGEAGGEIVGHHAEPTRHPVLDHPDRLRLDDVEEAEGEEPGDPGEWCRRRITSYNVCYTKLLRYGSMPRTLRR